METGTGVDKTVLLFTLRGACAAAMRGNLGHEQCFCIAGSNVVRVPS